MEVEWKIALSQTIILTYFFASKLSKASIPAFGDNTISDVFNFEYHFGTRLLENPELSC